MGGMPPRAVRYAPVVRQEIVAEIELVGSVRAVRQTDIGADTSGVIRAVHFLEGEIFPEMDEDGEPAVLIELAEGIFGVDAVKEWTAEGMDVELLGELIAWIPEAYDQTDDEDEDTDPGN